MHGPVKHKRSASRHRKVPTGNFQQAKKSVGRSRFLQIVAKPGRADRRKSKEPKLTRVAFRVSRLMEFCSKRELQNQTGHSVDHWPLVVLKELMDNALDAAEEAEVAPVISIAVKSGSITIQDNGPGIETETIRAILDYSIRVSSREAYVSPTRGAQGNALKTILPMTYVLDRERADERVELNALTSDELVEMIERKLNAYGLKKVIPNDDVLAEAYQAFHESQQLRAAFEELKEDFEATEVEVPKNLKKKIRAVFAEHPGLRWDEARQIVLDENQLDHVMEKKQKAKRKAGDFTDDDPDDDDDLDGDDEE
jgi:hypothetical protein